MGELRYRDRHTLRYDVHGEGDRTVVLVHGLLMNRRMYDRLAPEIAGRGVENGGLILAAPGLVPGGGDEDRKQAAGEAALAGHRQIELSLATAGEECASRVRPFALPQPQQGGEVGEKPGRRRAAGGSALPA